MIVLAARPSMGKTSLAMNIVENVALGATDHQPHPVAIFSLEMSREQLIIRMLGSHARIPAHRISSGYLTPANHGLLMQAADVLKKPLFTWTTPAAQDPGIRARARRLNLRYDITLFVMPLPPVAQFSRSPPRRTPVGSRPHLRLDQKHGQGVEGARARAQPVEPLSRSRDRGEPRLADLRDSGSIGKDADVVCLLRRPFPSIMTTRKPPPAQQQRRLWTSPSSATGRPAKWDWCSGMKSCASRAWPGAPPGASTAPARGGRTGIRGQNRFKIHPHRRRLAARAPIRRAKPR